MIVDFIHWSQSVFFSKALVWRDIFSQHAARRCKQDTSALPPSKSLSLSTTPSLTLIYPPSITLPHCDQHLTFTPFLLHALFFFFFFFSTHLKFQSLLLGKYHTIHRVHKPTRIPPQHWPAQLLFPNQKQTAINRAPSLLSHTGESLNQSVFS